MAQQMYDAATNAPRRIELVEGATHYFEEQPELLASTLDTLAEWIRHSIGDSS